jgi:hypothetical protein
MSHDHNQNDDLNEEEREKLRLENEILKLKMQAQFGAEFGGSNNEEFTPEMEHTFLKNVLAFEEQYQNRKMIKVYDLVGQPSFKSVALLNGEELKVELERLLLHMREKKVNLDVLGIYPDEVVYRFITEELFEHETDDMQAVGITQNFIYEEFHPNHKIDLEEAAMHFLKNWFEQNFDEDIYFLEEQILLPHITPPSFITREKVLSKLKQMFESYKKFDDCKYTIGDIGFQWNDEQNRGMGHVEGAVKYTAVLESGEQQLIEGAFKIYFSNQYGGWSVMHFIFPGFIW